MKILLVVVLFVLCSCASADNPEKDFILTDGDTKITEEKK